jgi:tetratricopeptide (TPR) repeat protein
LAVAIAAALKKHKQVKYVELDGALNLGGEEGLRISARAAESHVKAGTAKLKSGQYDDAVEELTKAVENYEDAYATLVDTTVLPKALALLGAAQLLGGDAKGAAKTLERAVQADPQAPLDLSEWSPKVQTALDTARKNVAARELIDFSIRSPDDQPFVRVHLNGRYLDLTPVYPNRIPKGEMFIILSKQGFVRSAMFKTVTKQDEVIVAPSLKPAARAPALDALKRELVSALTKSGAAVPAEVEGLTNTPYAVLLRADGSHDKMRVQLALVGLASRQIIHQVSREVVVDTRKATREQAAQMVEEVLKPRVIAAGVDPGVVAAKPIYQRWWFWGIVAAVAGGSVAAYTLTAGEPPPPSTYKAGTGGLILQF